ncbi:HD-GYP domain-containing protein [Rahnella sp. PCH160]|uniref:HD-GYP domain-containing protein n=1 Tax=Rahnella sp. PCH160 TaxID=3447928 RepID=UPI0039FB9F99
MNVNFTDFLTAFSSALDLLNPETPHRSTRRAYITQNIARHRGLSQPAQRRLFIAALLWDFGNGSHSPAHGAQRLSNIPLVAECAGLVCGAAMHNAEHRLLQLANDLAALSLNEYPRGHYPEKVMQTLCDSIGSKYALDDVIALRDLGLFPEFWKQLASSTLSIEIRLLAPFPAHSLTGHELLQLTSLLARVIDTHCCSAIGHSFKVAELSVQLGRLYGFSDTGIEKIHIAGLLHDLGKLAVPAAVLTQKKPLNEMQRKQIFRHPLHTWDVLSVVPGLCDVAQVASFHHERLDGKGYPFFLKSTQLDLGSRIVSVADNYAALTEERCYKVAYSPEKSFAIMEENARNGGLDAAVIGALKSSVSAAGMDIISASSGQP